MSELNGVQKDKPLSGKENHNRQARELKKVTPKNKTFRVYVFYSREKKFPVATRKNLRVTNLKQESSKTLRNNLGLNPMLS